MNEFQDPIRGQDPVGQSEPRGMEVFQAIGSLASSVPTLEETMRDIGRMGSETASGLEFAGIQALSAGKSFVDAGLNVFGLAFKSGAGAASAATGAGFAEGYEQAGDLFEQQFGRRDPDILDVIQKVKGGDPIGDAADDYFQKRLGKYAFAGETIGHLASFASGPVSLVGKGGAAVAKPLTKTAERIYAKTIGKAAGGTVKDGRVWEFVANTPQWKQTLAKAGQGYLGDTISTTAALVAQSYATAPDDERLDAAKSAASMGWMMVPVARAGERAAEWVMRSGMNARQAANVRDAIARVETGEMQLPQLDAIIKANTPAASRALAHYVVAPMSESLALMLPTKESRDLLYQAISGDPEAGAMALAVWLSTAGGLAAAKGLVPHNLAPLFKTVRPDANKLSLYLEAQANREVSSPQQPEGPIKYTALDPKTGNIVRPEQNRYQLWDAARKEWIDTMDVMWAEVPADAAIKGGWTPEAVSSGVLELRFGQNHSARIRRLGETGEIEVTVGPRERAALKDMGVELPAGSLGDQAASYALESLTLLGMFRRLQADVSFQKMGLREVEPGTYVNDANGKFVRVDLDGKVLERDFDSDVWSVSENQTMDYGVNLRNAKWNNPTGATLSTMLMQKQAMSPDPLVDGILTYVLAEAQAGESVGAAEIRKFLEQTDVNEFIASIKPGSDRQLAIELGRIAMGHDNAAHAMAVRQQAAAKQQPGAGREGEAGSIIDPIEGANIIMDDVIGAGKALVEGGVKGAEVTAAGMKEARSWMTKTQADEIADLVPGNEVSPKGREVQGRGAQLVGETTPAVRSIREATKADKGRLKASTAAKAKRRIAESTIPADEVFPGAKGRDMRVSAIRMLADKRIKPEGKTEEAFVEAAQKGLMGIYETTRQAGAVRVKDGKSEPVPKSKQSVVQYRQGQDRQKVMESDDLRKAYFEDRAAINQDVMVPKTVEVKDANGNVVMEDGVPKRVNVYEGKGADRKQVMEPVSGEWFERQYQANQRKVAKGYNRKVSDPEVEQAVEFSREFNDVDVWRGHEMLDTNVTRAIDSSLREQAYRAAEIEIVGQDVPNREAVIADFKKRLEADPGNKDLQRSLDMLENRPGVSKLIEGLGETALKQGRSGPEAAEIQRRASDWFRRIQNEEPIKLNKWMRAMRNWNLPTSMIKAWRSGVYDPPEMFFRLATYFPIKDVRGAFAEVFGTANPRKWPQSMKRAIEMAEDFGTVLRESGQTFAAESDSYLQKAADIVSKPSTAVEKAKGALFTSAVNIMLRRIKAGKANTGDLLSMRADLRLTQEQMRQVESGKLSDNLEAQIRREYVTYLTNRVSNAEGSRFASDPRASAMLRFTRFATSRLESIIKTVQAIGRAGSPAERRYAIKRSLKLFGGLTLSGMAAQSISMMLSELFRSGRPDIGLKTYWNMLSYDPLMTISKALTGQIIGGPLAAAASVVTFDVNSVSDWARLTFPTEVAFNVGKSLHAVADGDWLAPWTFMVNTGLIPGSRDLDNLFALGFAAAGGESMTARTDEAMVRTWMREEGIEQGRGPKNKPDEFYDALANVMTQLKRDGTDKERLDFAMNSLREALALAPEESVAAAIDARRQIAKLGKEEMAKLQEFLNDDVQFDRVVQRDKILHRLSKQVRRMEGTNPTEWETDLEMVTKQAVHGVDKHWSGMVDRAVEETAERMVAGERSWSQIDDLAEALAPFHDQWGSFLTEKQIAQISRRNTVGRMRSLSAILRERAVDKSVRIRTEKRAASRKSTPK